MSITDESELQRTALGGLKGHGKKGTIGTKRTGNATLSKSLNTGYCKPIFLMVIGMGGVHFSLQPYE